MYSFLQKEVLRQEGLQKSCAAQELSFKYTYILSLYRERVQHVQFLPNTVWQQLASFVMLTYGNRTSLDREVFVRAGVPALSSSFVLACWCGRPPELDGIRGVGSVATAPAEARGALLR